ncbi:MAG: site-2 protease family protein [Clostridia bacterium]|nr:site-2 protease family protein [Clostridia bacterium]
MNIWNTVWPILVAIVVFGLIVFIHEFGHFIFAKLFNIKVNEFAIGFGPAILKFQKGETKYALRILPFGGYCAMEGEDEESDDERAFSKAKPFKRIIVVAAGAVFNIILGFILMVSTVSISGATQSQNLIATTSIASFEKNATTNKNGGLKEKDKIIKMNGRRVFSVDEISYILGTCEDNKVDLVVKRNGKTTNLNDVEFPQITFEGRKMLSIDFYIMGEKATFINCVKQGFWRTVSMGRIVFMSLGDLISGKFGLNDVSGPVGVTQVVSEAVSGAAVNGLDGLAALLKILCLITVNLGVFNLLPIPALDGSRIWFLVIEWIKGSPVKREALVHSIGMVILLVFMGLIIFKDLWAWIF